MDEFHLQVECTFCSKKISQKRIDEHIQVCMNRIVTCKYCELEVPFSEIKEHESLCGSKTEQCTSCQMFIPIRDFDRHIAICVPSEKNKISSVFKKKQFQKPYKKEEDDRDVHEELKEKIDYLLKKSGKGPLKCNKIRSKDKPSEHVSVQMPIMKLEKWKQSLEFNPKEQKLTVLTNNHEMKNPKRKKKNNTFLQDGLQIIGQDWKNDTYFKKNKNKKKNEQIRFKEEEEDSFAERDNFYNTKQNAVNSMKNNEEEQILKYVLELSKSEK